MQLALNVMCNEGSTTKPTAATATISAATVITGWCVDVHVLDLNDNAPVLVVPGTRSSPICRRRLSSPGRRLLRLTAADRDDPSSPNSVLVYRLLGQVDAATGRDVDVFEAAVTDDDVDGAGGGWLVAARSEDPDDGHVSSTVRVKIRVSDRGIPPMSTDWTLTVNIDDDSCVDNEGGVEGRNIYLAWCATYMQTS